MNPEEMLIAWRALGDAPSVDDLEGWRAMRDRVQVLLDAVNACLRASDEAELARIQARAAELQARLGFKIAAVQQPARPRTKFDETDAGMGIGEPDRTDVSASDFNAELAELRERTRAKRKRLHA